MVRFTKIILKFMNAAFRNLNDIIGKCYASGAYVH